MLLKNNRKIFRHPSLIISSVLLSSSFLAIQSAQASDFGCQAVLCFAGGRDVNECQPTIKKVLRDLAKGKSFPSCTFVGSVLNDSNNSSQQQVTSKVYRTYKTKNQMCEDGVTQPIKTLAGRYCRVIQVDVPADYSADKKHQTLYYNY